MIRGTLTEVCTAVIDCKNRTAPEDPHGSHFAVGTPAMRGNVINLDEARRINDETFAEWTARLTPQPGDLLFAREAPVGPVVEIPEGTSIAPGQRTMLLRADPAKANNRFLRYYLISPATQARLHALAHGSTVPHLRLPVVRNFEVSLPELPVQKAIAEVLGALDDKIAANARIASTADSLATTIAQRTFNDSPTVSLEDIAVITMGSSPKGETLNAERDGFVFYQGIRDFGLRSPVKRVWTTSPIRMAQASDTLLSVRAPVGTVNIAQEALCIGRGLASIRSIPNTPYSLFHAVKSSPVWQQYNAEGTVFGTINRKQLAAAQIRWKAPEQMQELEDSLSPLEELLSQTLETNKKLSETRDALLPQLMSGKLCVKDAEAIVESVV